MSGKSEGNPIVGFLVLCLLGFALYSCVSGPAETPEERRVREANERLEAAEDKMKGFHCLSNWDGSHSAFRDAVQDRMRDPDSFEHMETRVTPVSAEGTHTIFMKYRARNGFGGMNVGTAVGTYKNSDCSFTLIAVE